MSGWWAQKRIAMYRVLRRPDEPRLTAGPAELVAFRQRLRRIRTDDVVAVRTLRALGRVQWTGREQQMSGRIRDRQPAATTTTRTRAVLACPSEVEGRRAGSGTSHANHATSPRNQYSTSGFCVGMPKNDATPRPIRSPRTCRRRRDVRDSRSRPARTTRQATSTENAMIKRPPNTPSSAI